MNNILLCEGSTDYTLLQYYMRKAYGWSDDKGIQNSVFKVNKQKSRKLSKNDSFLTIAAVGGCSRLIEGLELAIERNKYAAPNHTDFFDSIVIITDRDELLTEKNFIDKINKIFLESGIGYQRNIVNNQWIECNMTNNVGLHLKFRFLLLIIPFEQNGAMETFLLNAIADDNLYDKEIIKKCNHFVDTIDPEKRYLSNRRLITKAKFDTYFSVRTSAEQFC